MIQSWIFVAFHYCCHCFVFFGPYLYLIGYGSLRGNGYFYFAGYWHRYLAIDMWIHLKCLQDIYIRLRLKKLFALEFLQRCPLAPRSQNIFNILLYRACGKWYVQFLIWCGWLGTGQIGRFLTGRITFHRPGRAKC